MDRKRKARSDAKLLSLPDETKVQIATWLTYENKSYKAVRLLVRKEFGLTTSNGALHHFFGAFAAPWKYAKAAGAADEFANLMEGKFDAASIKLARQLAFDALAAPTPDLRTAKTLLKIVNDSAKQAVQERRLALDIDKFRELVKTGVEKGLDALQVELKGNDEALALFERMKALVLKTVEEAR